MKKHIIILTALLFGFVLKFFAQQSYPVIFVHDGKTIYGTFKVPAGQKKFKTIIICPGSGPNDRNGTLPMVGANVACLYPGLLNDTLRPYAELSDALQAEGYAVLIYDKMEYTYTSTIGAITFHKLWLPVESAINYVKTRNDVDTQNIILMGHSEGSSLIPFIARGRKDIKALISIAGSRTPFDSTLARQIVGITQTCHGDTTAARNQASQIHQYFNLIRTNTWNGSTPPLSGVPASAWYQYVRATDSVSVHYNACKLPTLFIGLGLDINVPPAELARFRKEVTVTNDFWEIPSLIHYMVPGNIPHVARVVPDTIIYWLRNNGLHSGVGRMRKLERQVRVYPNPFVSELSISFDMLSPGSVQVVIEDIQGRIVYRESAEHTGTFLGRTDLRDLPSGVYVLKLQSGSQSIVRKILKQ